GTTCSRWWTRGSPSAGRPCAMLWCGWACRRTTPSGPSRDAGWIPGFVPSLWASRSSPVWPRRCSVVDPTVGESTDRAEVRVEARAKLNVFLRVLGRRADGYHELESLVLPVSFADRVTVRADARLSFRMLAAGPFPFEPIDPGRNLALQAAEQWV